MEGRWTCQLAFAVLSASLGSFLFGYNIGCINMPADLIKSWFAQSSGKDVNDIKTEWAVAVSIFAVGGIFGGISVGFFADLLGRIFALQMTNLIALVAYLMFTCATKYNLYWLFIVARLVIGLSAGLNSGLVPMYLTEISPANLRGTIGSFAQLFVTISILVSQIVGLPSLLGTKDRWIYIFHAIISPTSLQSCMLIFCPESPKYSLQKLNNRPQAEKDLIRLRGHSKVHDELNLIAKEAASARADPNVTFASMFNSNLCWPLVLSVFMMVSQQLSGINAAMFYSPDIFKKAGLEGQWPNYATIAMGAINVLMTVVSVYLVDRLGRRTLLIGGFIGTFFCTALIAVSMLVVKNVSSLKWFSYMSIASVLAFVISFAAGPGSIPWFFVSEVFPLNARGKANSIAVFTNWFFTFVVGMVFPLVETHLHEYSFFVFTFLLFIFIMFAWKYMPETKNKTLMEVYIEMDKRRGIHDGVRRKK